MNTSLLNDIGPGRDRDYGHLGLSHWAEEDVKVLSTLENIQLDKPKEGSNKIW
jgi:transketolase